MALQKAGVIDAAVDVAPPSTRCSTPAFKTALAKLADGQRRQRRDREPATAGWG